MFYTAKNTFSCSEGPVGFLFGFVGGGGVFLFMFFVFIFLTFGLFEIFSGWDYMDGGYLGRGVLFV